MIWRTSPAGIQDTGRLFVPYLCSVTAFAIHHRREPFAFVTAVPPNDACLDWSAGLRLPKASNVIAKVCTGRFSRCVSQNFMHV